MQEFVRKPTREEHLLDLVLSDLQGCISTKVVDGVSDHRIVLGKLAFGTPSSQSVSRMCWQFGQADWKGPLRAFRICNWNEQVDWSTANFAATTFSNLVLSTAKTFIPYRFLSLSRSSHPWLTAECYQAIAQKAAAC